MSNKFENEIEEHKKQLEGIKKIYKEEKEVLQDKYNKCNSTNKKNLVELKKTKIRDFWRTKQISNIFTHI